MSLQDTLIAVPPPLRVDESGTVRVGGSRVILDLVIGEHKRGATPEQIVDAYPALQLPDVYAVIAHYLSHREEVDAYLAHRQAEAEELRRTIEADPRHQAFRAKMRERLERYRRGER